MESHKYANLEEPQDINYTPLSSLKKKFNLSRNTLILGGATLLIVILSLSFVVFAPFKQNKTQQLTQILPTPTTVITISPTQEASVSPNLKVTTKPIAKVSISPTVVAGKHVANPPNYKISYPAENETVTLNAGQTLCIVDAPAGGGDNTGLQKRQKINTTDWTGYTNLTSTVCFDPNEGQNTVIFQYKNSYGEESAQQSRTFSFHRNQQIIVKLSGRFYSDNNCNSSWDSGEGNVNGSVTVNIFKSPEFYILQTVNSGSDGTFNVFNFEKQINEGESLSVQAIPVSPDGYKNPKSSNQIVTLNKSNNNYMLNLPQVPNENVSSCQ